MKIPIRINIRIEKEKYILEWCGKDRQAKEEFRKNLAKENSEV